MRRVGGGIISYALVAALAFTGCASITPAERACIIASAADMAATAYALDSSPAITERNRALTLAGDDAATVVLTSAAVTAGWIVLTRKIGKRNPRHARSLNWTCAGLRTGAAAYNLSVTGDADY